MSKEQGCQHRMEYAIVDIETTGTSAKGSCITEIAIVIHDGTTVLERWETLVNPMQPIPFAITALTGITNEMVAKAPLFSEVADPVFKLLEGRVFVAHNVNFDYSFVKHQLAACGHTLHVAKLCTVRLARKIIPEVGSYSLGKLCRLLGIPHTHHHRAGGDAAATTILFEKLMGSDHDRVIPKMLQRNSAEQRLPTHLPPETFHQLPESTGVYYFHDRRGKVIYVGKAINIKKRVAGHFSGHVVHVQRQDFLREVYDISFEFCGNELMALLLECAEIQRLWPKYNKALKRPEAKYGLITYQAQNNYTYISLIKLAKHQFCHVAFYSLQQGIKTLQDTINTYDLDMRLCQFAVGNHSERILLKRPSMEGLPSVDEYNDKVAQAMEAVQTNRSSFVVMGKGRTSDEESCVWIEQGRFYGMGYVDRSDQSSELEGYKECLTRHAGNQYMMQVMEAFLEKWPAALRVIPLDDQRHLSATDERKESELVPAFGSLF